MRFDYARIEDVMLILTDRFPILNLNKSQVNKPEAGQKRNLTDEVIRSFRVLEYNMDSYDTGAADGYGYQFYNQVHFILAITLVLIWSFSKRRNREIYLKPHFLPGHSLVCTQ